MRWILDWRTFSITLWLHAMHVAHMPVHMVTRRSLSSTDVASESLFGVPGIIMSAQLIPASKLSRTSTGLAHIRVPFRRICKYTLLTLLTSVHLKKKKPIRGAMSPAAKTEGLYLVRGISPSGSVQK